MRRPNLFLLLVAGLSLFAAEMKAEDLPIRWIVKQGHEANKLQVERLYLEATGWIEDRFGSPKQILRPGLTIHVGESCPDPGIAGACQTAQLGEVYIPEWDEGAPGYIVQATLVASLHQLMSRQELHQVTRDLLTADAANFLDAPTVAQRTEK